MAEEHLEQGELRPRQLDPYVPAPGLVGQEVERQALEAQYVPRLAVLPAAQERPDPGHQLPEGERLDQIVVGPGVEAGHPVVDPVPGGQHQHRRPVAGRPQPPADLDPREPGHRHVEHDDIEPLDGQPVESGAAVGGEGDAVALERERARERLPHRRLVVDDEYLGSLRHARMTASRLSGPSKSRVRTRRRADGRGGRRARRRRRSS